MNILSAIGFTTSRYGYYNSAVVNKIWELNNVNNVRTFNDHIKNVNPFKPIPGFDGNIPTCIETVIHDLYPEILFNILKQSTLSNLNKSTIYDVQILHDGIDKSNYSGPIVNSLRRTIRKYCQDPAKLLGLSTNGQISAHKGGMGELLLVRPNGDHVIFGGVQGGSKPLYNTSSALYHSDGKNSVLRRDFGTNNYIHNFDSSYQIPMEEVMNGIRFSRMKMANHMVASPIVNSSNADFFPIHINGSFVVSSLYFNNIKNITTFNMASILKEMQNIKFDEPTSLGVKQECVIKVNNINVQVMRVDEIYTVYSTLVRKFNDGNEYARLNSDPNVNLERAVGILEDTSNLYEINEFKDIVKTFHERRNEMEKKATSKISKDLASIMDF